MGYQPRRILPGGLYEVTVRTFQARYFFVPNKTLNQLIAGAMACVNKYLGLFEEGLEGIFLLAKPLRAFGRKRHYDPIERGSIPSASK